ncbi:zinc finger and BTB domain-containing protein 40 isoform X5 [Peromyscus californicus insignis]|uniref:zinc finger and BTB domain-containing protein 40 isoform X5 n=1 Tax=Peromyscus californicus insignis TaxID=564181 RepID=UPI0022A6D0F7|nr:zinc finger and BTB domain-containing protein 40 isoform X5 [Peromyscus californicus insignis]
MELPNYSQQLLLQLYALCKEQRFCDCTISIGNIYFRAHKLVLAAASLLFKTLLDSTDAISIDASVVSPEEFALLLEMTYTGKLPMGKHNFSKIISLADSLQMFDVAVGCKNLLTNLVNCSVQGQVVRDISVLSSEAGGKESEKPQVEVISSEGPGEPSSSLEVSTMPAGPEKAKTQEMNSDPPVVQVAAEVTGVTLHTAGVCSLSPAGQIPSEAKEANTETECERKQDQLNFLLEHESVFSNAVLLTQDTLKRLEECPEIKGSQKQVILNCCEGRTPKETIEKLLHRMAEEKTLPAESLVKLLQAVRTAFPNLGLLLENLQKVAESPGTAGLARVTCETERRTEGPRRLCIPADCVGESLPSPEDYGAELLRKYHENLSEVLTDNQVLLKMISHVKSLAPGDREVMETLVKQDSGSGGFSSLMSAALERQTLSATAVWQLLLVAQEAQTCPLNLLLEEVGREPGAGAFFRAVTAPESIVLETILRHSRLVTEAVQQMMELKHFSSEDERLAEIVKEMLSISSETVSPEVALRAVLSKGMEKSVSATALCHLLCSVHKSFSGLQPLMQELAHGGFLTKENGEESLFMVSDRFHSGAKDKEEKTANAAREDCQPTEQKDRGEPESVPEQQEKDTSASPDSAKKSFICKACDKSFHFYCRLKVHMKRCRVAKSKQVQCKDSSETKDSEKGLQKHQPETHGTAGEPDAPKKKKKRLPVACDLCGREFAHASGMQYHKLTEHFDEKPFSCEECGAKFAANSTLKNHLRLHTGDRPFMCKHCLMTFTQASALAYHTKKKHSEGKMYACQYCDAVFAQSIELSRHVRTHTGDKPYVCRDCGKGFRQANGLSIHLHTFHNIEDPYDCKKCKMSFPTLQDHRKHIHEVHSKEYHPCPTCGKIFSAPSMLERHMVTHVGGKPFSCGICNKAYQQLSGLWYHNRTHHPDVFAAQNHRSPKFSSLQCSSCDKTFSSTIEHKKHIKAEHADLKFHECDQCKELFPTPALLQVHVKCQHSGSQPFRCLYCAATFRFPGALQHHVTTEHFKQSESTFPCELCGELFTSQAQLDSHLESEHPKVTGTETQAAASQTVQVIQAPEPAAPAEQVITLEETQLAGSQVFVTLPDSQTSQNSSELVAVTVEDLLDGTVTLICGEAK